MKKPFSDDLRLKFFLWFAGAYWLSGHGFAATLTVTTTDDDGAGSLRQAIQTAATGDAIAFAVTGEISLISGELLITNRFDLIGPGAGNLALRGN